jgi:hypothetical protein
MNVAPRWRPSPAIVIASFALAVALSGTGYAAFVLPANSVGTKQLKKNAVSNPKIKNSAITGAKVKNDSLTGADVLESTLGKVPSAAKADDATTAQRSVTADHAAAADRAINAASATNANYANFAGFAQGANELNGLIASELAPYAAGQHDTSAASVTVTAGGQTEIDSVPIHTLGDRFFVISGSVFLNNNTAADTLFDLIPKVDGATIGDGTKATTKLAADTGGAAVGEIGSLAYTAVVFVKAGDHTVTQTTGPQAGTADFAYNLNNLSVISVPFGESLETP